jgi:hypothetical protein
MENFNMRPNFSCKTYFQAIQSGAALGLAAALVYGMGFVIYGILRTSTWIIAHPANELFPTLLANAVSVVIGAMFFAVLFGLFAAVFQAVTLALVFGLTRRIPPASNSPMRAMIGLVVSGGLFLTLLILFHGGPQIMTQVFWNQSFIFWFGMPGAVYVLMNTLLGNRLDNQ